MTAWAEPVDSPADHAPGGSGGAGAGAGAGTVDPTVEVRYWDPDVVHQLEAVDGQDNYHRCIQHCGKPLACKHHNCDELCHLGPCPPCAVSLHTPLTCACGASVIPPPVRCGREPPTCNLPCSVVRPCGHPPGAWHTCHFGECPLCVALTSKYVPSRSKAQVPGRRWVAGLQCVAVSVVLPRVLCLELQAMRWRT